MKHAEVDAESITSDPTPFIPPGEPPGEPPVGEPEPDPEPLGDPVYPGDPGPAEDPEIQPVHVQGPSVPAFAESFNGRLRDECLNTNWFRNLWEARRKITAWRNEYNNYRPHSSLDYRTPQEFAQTLPQLRTLC